MIGAGMAGTSAAAVLAEKGRRVAVLERESQPAYHSTGRSAALFSTIYGGEVVRALSRASQPFFEAPPEGFAEAPLIRPRSTLFVADEARAEAFEALVALSDVGGALSRIAPEQALALCPILKPDYVRHAALEATSADVDVHGLHQGYLRRLRAHGGALLCDRPVEGLERSGSGWRVRAGGEDLSAPVVVNAAGAWADEIGRLAGAQPIGLQPMRRTAVLVDPPEGVRVDDWPMVIDAEESFYFKPDAGLLLLSPADETPCDPCDAQPEEWDVAVAVDRVETATTLQVRRVKHRWAGLRSFVADRTPVAGFDPDLDGFFWLAGQGGYGIQTAPALARAAAALALGEPLPSDLIAEGVEAKALSPERLKLVIPAGGPRERAVEPGPPQ